jgi:Ca2+-binding RTX toxin-like protein
LKKAFAVKPVLQKFGCRFVKEMTLSVCIYCRKVAANRLEFVVGFRAFGVSQVLRGSGEIGQPRLSLDDGASWATRKRGLEGMSNVVGNAGDNLLVGSVSEDVISGGFGDDTLNGLGGNDNLIAEAGNDVLVGDLGNDTLNGGDGQDLVAYERENGGGGVVVNLQTGIATDSWGNTDTLISIERVDGTDKDDQITGSDLGGDFLFGGAGNDLVSGGGGNDTLIGDAGNDTLNGGVGMDQVNYVMETGSRGVKVDLASGQATDSFGNTDVLNSIEYVLGGAGNDTLLGSNAGNERLYGGDGDDFLDGRDGNNLIVTGAGNDTVKIGTAATGARDTVVISGFGNKTISGSDSQGTRYGHHIVFQVDEAVTVNLATGMASSARMNVDFTQGLFFLELGGSAYGDRLIGGNTRHDYLEWFCGNQGNDTIDGGSGIHNTVVYDSEVEIGSFSYALGIQEYGTQGVVINLATGVATDSFGDTDTLIRIDDVRATRFADMLTGSGGDNQFWGLGGADTLDGGAGNDSVLYGEDFRTGGTAGVSVDLGTGTAIDGFGNLDTLISVENVYGTSEGDRFYGNEVANLLYGYEGDDSLYGGAGDDVMLGSDGIDVVVGGDGDDELWGGAGADTLDGGNDFDLVRYLDSESGVVVNLITGVALDGFGSTDTLISIERVHGSDFADQITGDASVNRLFGWGGDDSILGGEGDDILLGGLGNDKIFGGLGNDEIWGEAGNDRLDGGEGADLARYLNSTSGMMAYLAEGYALDGMGGTDQLISIEHVHGSGFADLLIGSGEANRLFGMAGSDTLYGAGGNDTLSGGAGGDTYVLAAQDGYDLISDLGQSSGGDDRIIFADYLAGEATIQRQSVANNNLVFNFGNVSSGDYLVVADSFTAGEGAVEFFEFADGTVWDLATVLAHVGQVGALAPPGPATLAAETLAGTVGADRLAGFGGDDTLTGGDAGDILRGDAGNDWLYGGEGADTLNGGLGDDFLFGGNSTADLRDVIYGGDGNDSISADYGNDLANGGNGNDSIEGGFGADTLYGQGGDDVLSGSAFSDQIFGGDGFDFINGGFGSDRLNGGDGADMFYHLGVAGHGSDWIQDYSATEGDLLVTGISNASVDQFQVNLTETTGAGTAGVAEAFVIYRPTGQILWALVDGGAQEQINLMISNQVYDLLA